MERTRVWRGTVKPEARDEHERFVSWLGSDEAAVQYAKFLLTGYSLAQEGDELTITLASEDPLAMIRFLRNHRMWPDFWEYQGTASSEETPAQETVRVQWRRHAA